MRPLPLNIQTLYADLAQSATFAPIVHGSVYAQTAGGTSYLYATEKHGSKRIQRYLGRADDPDVRKQAEDIRRAAEDARLRRRTVSTIKRLGVPAPTLQMGRLLEAVANAGLFAKGIVLVGTGAYQLYSPVVGVALSRGASSTQDADLAAVSLAVVSNIEGESLLDILERADPTFVPQASLDHRTPPRRFRSRSGFEVDVITRYRKRADDERAVVIPGLRCSAQPLRYLEYLTADPISAVALYGPGIQVKVPQPARYAVHKLILAQVRSEISVKRSKDLAQAKELIEALRLTDPHSVDDAIEIATGLGAKWRSNIGRSLREIGLADNH